MSTELIFREYEDALEIQAANRPSTINIAISTLVAGGSVGVMISAYAGASVLGSPAYFADMVVAAVFGFLKGKFPRRTELKVTNLEFRTRSFGAWGFEQGTTISRMDARWLEFRDDNSGSDGGRRGGLHAILKYRSVCLLPDVNAEQSAAVVDRIATKFTNFREQWRTESGFGRGLITLELNQPSPGS